MHHRAGAKMSRLRIFDAECPLLVVDEMNDRHVYKPLLLTGIERLGKEGREGEGKFQR